MVISKYGYSARSDHCPRNKRTVPLITGSWRTHESHRALAGCLGMIFNFGRKFSDSDMSTSCVYQNNLLMMIYQYRIPYNGWLVGWLVGSLVGWSVAWLVCPSDFECNNNINNCIINEELRCYKCYYQYNQPIIPKKLLSMGSVSVTWCYLMIEKEKGTG